MDAFFRELTGGEIDRVLRRNHVGRLATSFRDRVNITPIHYVYADGWIYGRTSPGHKLLAIAHNRWVAFEVDEVEGLYNWRSVVVHGGFYLIDPADSDHERAVWNDAVTHLRSLVPATFRANDPTAWRTEVFRIHLDEVTGREAFPGASSRQQGGQTRTMHAG